MKAKFGPWWLYNLIIQTEFLGHNNFSSLFCKFLNFLFYLRCEMITKGVLFSQGHCSSTFISGCNGSGGSMKSNGASSGEYSKRFCILGIQTKRSGAYFRWICSNIVFPQMNINMNMWIWTWTCTMHMNMCLPQVGDGRRESKSTEPGVFAFRGCKLSDLVQRFREFVGMLLFQNRYVSSSIEGGRRGSEMTEHPPPTPGSFCILGIQSKRPGA